MEDLESTGRSTTQMLDVYAGPTINDDVRELRTATAAFLVDRYDNGTYVATPDDIAELQEATAAFLADRADGDCFIFGPAGSGLLLPGEQFLVPIPKAVNRIRSTDDAIPDIIDLIDECLNAQLTYEGAPHIPLLDTAIMDLEATKAQCTSSHALKPDLLPQIPELEEQRLPPQEHLCVAFEDLLESPGEMDRQLGKYENADSDDSDDEIDTVSDDAASAFNAPDALCHFQASNVASFFDPVADAVVPYASFDQLLEMDDRHMQLACVQQVSEDDIDDIGGHAAKDDDGTDEQVSETVRIDNNNTFVDLDDIDAVCDQFPTPSTAQLTEHGKLKITTYLPTIWEENDPYSTASNSSMDFVDHRGSIKSFESRRENFLDDKEEFPQSVTGTRDFNDLFADDVWTNAPDLDLALPVSQPFFTELVHEAEFELFETLTAVFEVMRARSSTDVPTFGADLKRRLRLLIGDFERLVLTERLGKFIDVTVDRMVALDQHNSIVT